ncbi:hypothetical protein DFH09DRAFT_918101 [Mycena vulgaris]|nr:hypothetical protein DFH09DRAFT_918101 [Mycena vulgaris]
MAQTAVCLVRRRPAVVLLVLVVERSTPGETTDPKAHAVAGAIAAFQSNNNARVGSGLAPLERTTIPCISMAGTRPTFYLVPVTRALSAAVAAGQYPAAETVVAMCVTPGTRASDGMDGVEYRTLALRRIRAFRELAESHWETVLSGVWPEA